jgi:hypothetical protein
MKTRVRTPCVSSSAVLLFFSAAVAFGNPLPAFQDGEFPEGVWSHHVVRQEGAGDGAVTRHEAGGNPGAYLEISTWSESPLWTILWYAAPWDPEVFGPIESLMLEIDEKAVASSGNGQNLKLVVVQNGRFYLAPLEPSYTGGGTGTTWQTLFFEAVDEDDFAECPPPWPHDPTERPDFSIHGAPLYFGFMVGLTGAASPPRVHAYDNWAVWPQVPPVSVDPSVESEAWSRIKGFYRRP